ncbi:hypothetical protein OGAPHI_002347 [Ogataea philodendri]|uniref:Uncharacterized protein n=1 Tax=Ogataea philodendri TaxID=1378263 RepID=A0A9P8PAH9_9ASCO|nr:uncharacterized protein OGAPHI_002347 [Ogataea philodendri]KAH3668593.1 hypothetical protein OGAPHI_002347 [Ogataea philodendri]
MLLALTNNPASISILLSVSMYLLICPSTSLTNNGTWYGTSSTFASVLYKNLCCSTTNFSPEFVTDKIGYPAVLVQEYMIVGMSYLCLFSELFLRKFHKSTGLNKPNLFCSMNSPTALKKLS